MSRVLQRIFLTGMAAASIAAMPSCIFVSHMGEYVRSGAETHVGADVQHPVGQVLYRDNKRRYYANLPEVTYTPRHRVFTTEFMEVSPPDSYVRPRDIRPTGRTLCAEVTPFATATITSPGRKAVDLPMNFGYARTVESLPGSCSTVPLEDLPVNRYVLASDFGPVSVERHWYGGVLKALALPVSYIIDPVVSVTFTLVGNTCLLIGECVGFPFFYFQDAGPSLIKP